MSGATAAPAASPGPGQGPPDGELVVKIGGNVFGGWTSVNVTRGVERMPSDFDIQGTTRRPDEARGLFGIGKPLQITIGGHVVLTGYLERFIQRLSPTEHTVNLVGRGRCCDLVDTSALLSNATRSNTSVGVLARELVEPYAGPIKVVTPDGDGDAKTYTFSINLGESPFEIIERIARFEGLLTYENADGDLVLSRVGTTQHSSGFTEGANIEAVELTGAIDERFSVYIPLLMSSDTLNRDGLAPGGGVAAGERVYDKGVTRYRPRIIVSEQNSNEQFLAHQRAVWEATRRRGRGERISLVCSSWLDSSGQPWTPNKKATIAFPRQGIGDVPYVITDVSYRRDAQSGTTAHITMMPPEALTVQPSFLDATSARFGANQPGAAPGPLGASSSPGAASTAPNAGGGAYGPPPRRDL